MPRNGKTRWELRSFVKWMDELSVADKAAAPLEALDPFHTQFGEVEEAQYYHARRLRRAVPTGGVLKVMTWNIKFGGARIDFWFDGHGERVLLNDWEVVANLEGLAAKINQADPDVLLLQEVDVNSKRAAFVDQMQWLLDRTGLNYGAYASQWRADFVPTKGLGRVDSGIATLSKFPVRDAQRLALPEIEARDRLTRYFYLKRAMLTASVELPNQGVVRVVNIHTEPFANDGTKRRQLEQFHGELDRLDRAGTTFVAGGDLNSLAPGTAQQHGFVDVVMEDEDFQGGDYRQQDDWLTSLYEHYTPAVDLDDYHRDNRPHCTHSTSKEVFWNRKLDYLFTNGEFVAGSALTHQDHSRGGMKTMLLSDHAPVSVSLRL